MVSAHEIADVGRVYHQTHRRDVALLVEGAESVARGDWGRADLERELRETPELVRDWLLWSEDKRWSPAWYLRRTGDSFAVGYYDGGPLNETVYSDVFEACATFIVHELEDSREQGVPRTSAST